MKITDYLDETEILAQLAEESAELAQAALKLRRAITGTNPTPVTELEARDHLMEECADVVNCLILILHAADQEYIVELQREKRGRWMERLEEAYGKEKA